MGFDTGLKKEPMQLRIVKESEINHGLDAVIKKGLCTCFPKDRFEFAQNRPWHGSIPAYSLLIEDGKNIIAHAGVVDRTIKVENRTYRVAGVQSLFVMPEHRGTGLSDRVLKAAMQEAKDRDFEYGLLFTTKDKINVYARNSWLQITRQKFIRIEDGTEIFLPDETVKMYYPLKDNDFPKGIVNLQGNDW
jgi:GNAT superfamily N-acetyltransferase